MGAFLLVVLFTCAAVTAGQNTNECNDDAMRKCRRNIEDVVQGNGNTRRMELEDQCWRVRHNFDCVLWQTSMCLNQNEQEANSDSVLKAWRFLDGFCEKFKNWWTKPCYRSESLKRCENRLPSKGRSVDKASCRGYLDFRDCATSAIENQCNSDDQRLLGVYLMEKGQQRAWKCPKDETKYPDEPINLPFAVDNRDIMYSDSISGACMYNAGKQLTNCLNDFDSLQAAAKETPEDERQKKVCCGMVTYKDCVLKTIKDNCGAESSSQANSIIQNLKDRLFYKCEDYNDETCNAAGKIGATGTAAFFGFILSLLVSRYALNAA